MVYMESDPFKNELERRATGQLTSEMLKIQVRKVYSIDPLPEGLSFSISTAFDLQEAGEMERAKHALSGRKIHEFDIICLNDGPEGVEMNLLDDRREAWFFLLGNSKQLLDLAGVVDTSETRSLDITFSHLNNGDVIKYTQQLLEQFKILRTLKIVRYKKQYERKIQTDTETCGSFRRLQRKIVPKSVSRVN